MRPASLVISMLLFVAYELWSIIGDAGFVVSSVLPSAQAHLSFHIATGKMGMRPLDFYHAVQHLGQVAALRKDWSAKARTRWRTQQRHLLLRGEVEQVIAAVRPLCRGRHSKAIRT